MASLLTQTQKDQYNTVMNDVHDTWAREITAYKSAVKTVPTPDLGYNSIYGTRGPTQPVTFTPESFTLNARILYGKKAEEEYLSDEAVDVQNKIKIPAGLVRLKIKVADYDNAIEAKRFDFDSKKWIIHSDFRAHGLFGVQFYTLFVIPAS